MKITRILPALFMTASLFALVMSLFTTVHAANITVNSNLDTADPTPADGVCDVDGSTAGNQCTLRAAVETALAASGGDTIHFAGSMDIALSSSLPALSEDGLTIEAAPGQTVRINGQSVVENIFQISGSNVTISNVVIYGSGPGWSNIWVNDADQGVVIANNLIGDDDPAPGGCGQSNDSYGGIYVRSIGAVPTDTHRAWIYGNIIECHTGSPGEGITLYDTDFVFIGQDSDDTTPTVPGNNIRNNQTGVANYASFFNWISGNVIENNNGHGIVANGSVDTFVIGCANFSLSDPTSCRNKIRGNGEAGVYVSGNNTGPVGLARNWIGLADDGVTAMPNNIGIHLHTDNLETFVISNTISGNTEDGVRIQESNGGHEIWANVIGLGADGDTAVPNGSHGVYLVDDAGDNQIGSDIPAYGNTISGNSGHGILVSNTPSTTINSNLIGLAQNGVTPRGNGYNGIYALSSENTIIGPSPFAEESLGVQKISGNGEAGIYFDNVDNSFIGSANDITHNNGAGIYIYNGQNNALNPHLVWRNEGEGIQLSGNSAIYNLILPMEVSDNGRLPIDFGTPGLEPNDPGDADNGPNHLTNVPEVTINNGTVVTGTACVSCTIAIYEAKGDPTANGGGGVFRGVTFSDASGVWSFDLASVGLELRPVSFMAFTGISSFSSDNIDSSPLSPVTQVGFVIYLPSITR